MLATSSHLNRPQVKVTPELAIRTFARKILRGARNEHLTNSHKLVTQGHNLDTQGHMKSRTMQLCDFLFQGVQNEFTWDC